MGNGQNIQNALNRVVLEFKFVQENVTAQLQQIVAQTVLIRGLKHVNVLSSHVLQMVDLENSLII